MFDEMMILNSFFFCFVLTIGIPPSLRGKGWFYLCAAHKQKRKQPDLFHLLNQQPGKIKLLFR